MAFFSVANTVPVIRNSPHGHLMEIAAFLRRTPEAWTQGNEARDSRGNGADPLSPWARSWCLLGLMERFIRDVHTRNVALGMLIHVMPKKKGHPMPVHIFNDSKGRKITDVIAVLEQAATLPPGAAISQHEYCVISRAYHRALMAERLDVTASNYKVPDWSALACGPSAEAEKALMRDFDVGTAIIKQRDAGMPVAA